MSEVPLKTPTPLSQLSYDQSGAGVELEPLDPRSVERGGAEPVDFTPCVIPTVPNSELRTPNPDTSKVFLLRILKPGTRNSNPDTRNSKPGTRSLNPTPAKPGNWSPWIRGAWNGGAPSLSTSRPASFPRYWIASVEPIPPPG